MNNYDNKSLDELYGELNFLDLMLEERKEERKRKIEKKEEQLDIRYSQMQFSQDWEVQKSRELVDYKDKITDELEINDLRYARQKIKSEIDKRKSQEQNDLKGFAQQF
jgi:hypothetical protein